MDDEKKRESADADEESEASEGKSVAKSARKKPKLVLIIAAVVVIAVVGVAGYLLFAQSSQAGEVPGEGVGQEEGTTDSTTADDTTPARKSRRGGSQEKVESTNIFYTDFPTSIVNLGPSDNFDYVYLKYGFNLELGDEKVRAELTKKMPKIASVVDAALTGKKWDQIGTQRGRQGLEQEVGDAINGELETGKVIACYFVTFVAQ